MKHRFLLIFLCFLPFAAYAETQYVSDQLVITMRTGQGNQFQIIKTLNSGDKLEVLEQTDSGYTRARTEDGTEGWIRTQYLTDKPIAASKLTWAQNQISKLTKTNKALKDELKSIKNEKTQVDSEHSKLSSNYKQAEKELAHLNEIAARPIQLERENKELRLQFEQINDELVLVKQENQVLKDRSERNWFIAGAGVVILGMIIGLIIPKLRFRKKDSWGEY